MIEALSKKPKYKIGDVVTMDSGWDRQVLHKVTIEKVSANHGAHGWHRYWGTDTRRQGHGFYENQIRLESDKHKVR